MKLFRNIILFVLLIVIQVSAQIQFYTTSTIQVGPGIIHKKIIAPTVPWTINVLEVDLNNDYVSIESMKANNLLGSRETTSSMADRSSYQEHQVVGALNGDFYDGAGIPIGAQLLKGQILKRPIGRSVIGFDDQSFPMAGVVSYSGTLILDDLTTPIQRINEMRPADQLVLFNRYYGSSTGTNEWGTEVLVSPISEWSVNDTVLCLVDTVVSNVGNLGIPSGKAVLSGHGISETFLMNNIQIGDSLKLFISLSPGLQKLKNMVGGFPKIVKDGLNYAVQGYYEEGGGSTFHTDRHPRTAIGFSADSSKLFFITVDGRQDISVGINLIELADFMVDLGVENGINLDGGGSTTIVVRDQIENSPSDGSERPVSNALAVISSAPTGPLSNIQIRPDNIRVFIGKNNSFSTTGWDAYFNPSALISSGLEYSVDENIGTINNSGTFTAANTVNSGYIYVQYDDFKDSAFVQLKTATYIEISPKKATTDTIETIKFKMTAIDEDQLTAPLVSTDYQWESLNPYVGTVDSTGVFRGKAVGTTTIVSSFGELSDTATVTVEVSQGTSVIDSMESATNWVLSGDVYDSDATTLSVVDTPRTIGQKALKLDYQFERSGTARSYVFLDTDILIYGIPDSICIDIKSDGERHWTNFLVTDDNDEWFRGSTGQFTDLSTAYDTLRVATDQLFAIDPSSSFHYPIRFRRIEIRLGYYSAVGETNSGTLFLDNLRVTYPDITSYIPVIADNIPENFRLYQNYPNPFNSTTTIEFDLPESSKTVLTIFDISGRRVKELVNRNLSNGHHKVSWDTEFLASGVYFYRLETKSQIATKKMMLLK